MQTPMRTAPVSSKARWAGHIMSALVILFLLFDGIIKLVPLAPGLLIWGGLFLRDERLRTLVPLRR